MSAIDAIYYKSSSGNFGDDLNLALWPSLLPDHDFTFHNHDAPGDTGAEAVGVMHYFIGTILDARVVKAPRKAIFGSGVGYGTAPERNESWDVYFVRGPHSAAALGLPPEKALTDPAYLLVDLGWQTADRQSGVGFIPHHNSLLNNAWQVLCGDMGLVYIDPRQSPQEVVRQISGCDRVICEAMHGAIFADALRVPWRPIATGPGINSFKWGDYCQSVGLQYAPVHLPGLHYPSSGLLAPFKSWIKHRQARQLLRSIQAGAGFQLSSDRIFKDRLSALRGKVHELDQALKSGVKAGGDKT